MGLFDRFRKQDGPDEQVLALMSQLGDEAPAARLEACRSLGELGAGAVSAIPSIQELLCDDDGDVCLAAADAISRIERGF